VPFRQSPSRNFGLCNDVGTYLKNLTLMLRCFQLLQGFAIVLVRPPIVFYAFDLLRLNGQDLRSWPIEERKAKLAALLKRPPADIRFSASFPQNIDELLSKVRLQIRFEAIRSLAVQSTSSDGR
jgi:hypothetical protein